MWFSMVCTFIDKCCVLKRHNRVSPQQLATSQSARFALVTSAAYTHGQIVDAELANQSARFALVML